MNKEPNFGMPEVSYTPVGNIGMTTRFYGNLLTSKQSKLVWRIVAIIFGLMFSGFGILTLYLVTTLFSGGDMFIIEKLVIAIVFILFSALFTSIGVKVLYLNLYSKNL